MIYAPRPCRSCGNRLESLVDLGFVTLSGFVRPGEDRDRAPLVVGVCPNCKLVQLKHTVTRDALFRRYWYQSGINEAMRAELHSIVDEAVARLPPFEAGDAVLDIGANDGTLLARYSAHDPHVLRVAYEPAQNLQGALHAYAPVVVPDYFPEQYGAVKGLEGRVKVITAIAMVYAVDDLEPFLRAVTALLHEDGIWVVQFQDLAGMLRSCAFDNICHEHLTYPSLTSFSKLVAPFGLHVIDAEERAINGGSYRLTVARTHHQASPCVSALRQREAIAEDWEALEAFEGRVQERVAQIRAALSAYRSQGQVIDLYGASTKANTLLQVCKLDRRWLRQAWERSPEKVGRRTAGSEIPIVSEDEGRANPPAALLVGIWQFRDTVIAREHDYLRAGGRMIFPLPRVDVVQEVPVHAA